MFRVAVGLSASQKCHVCEVVITTITPNGSATLPFVIPSAADLSRRAVEGSAVLPTGRRPILRAPTSLVIPTGAQRSGGTCCSPSTSMSCFSGRSTDRETLELPHLFRLAAFFASLQPMLCTKGTASAVPYMSHARDGFSRGGTVFRTNAEANTWPPPPPRCWPDASHGWHGA